MAALVTFVLLDATVEVARQTDKCMVLTRSAPCTCLAGTAAAVHMACCLQLALQLLLCHTLTSLSNPNQHFISVEAKNSLLDFSITQLPVAGRLSAAG